MDQKTAFESLDSDSGVHNGELNSSHTRRLRLMVHGYRGLHTVADHLSRLYLLTTGCWMNFLKTAFSGTPQIFMNK